MSFNDVLEPWRNFSFQDFFSSVTDRDIKKVLEKESLRPLDFMTLLSPKASEHLEAIAQKAHRLTVQYFGRTVQLFIPLYVSNFCTNECIYCGFKHANEIGRKKLSIDEVDREASAIAATGMQHILMLTGESKKATPMSYLLDVVSCLKHHFASVSIEILPMETNEYQQMHQAGVDGLTVFQETYNQQLYKQVHLKGKKREYRYRLDTPERGAMAGFRSVNIGALLGLGEKRSEFFFTGLHAAYLDEKYMDTEISVSLPRFNPAETSFMPDYPVDDKTFTQFLMAFRLFMPRSGITISTRESAFIRDHLVRVGATKFSAGVCTTVGGYCTEENPEETPQFEITDHRSVNEVAQAITGLGYQPVYKDWDCSL